MKTTNWIQTNIVVVDGVWVLATSGTNPANGYSQLGLRHFNGANYLFGDGHVEWSPKGTYDTQTLAARESCSWWHGHVSVRAGQGAN